MLFLCFMRNRKTVSRRCCSHEDPTSYRLADDGRCFVVGAISSTTEVGPFFFLQSQDECTRQAAEREMRK
ncbi:unnamed protein product [Ectocarpus sp. CCAP 1310/34]|nr:unnamed protein product [Ectocarpus sp. CCAP 1310/34]